MLADRIAKIKARHVIWATVPHVTIVPIARGVAKKVRPKSRYFPYYTRPGSATPDFDPADDPNITRTRPGPSIRRSTSTTTRSSGTVRDARKKGRDWYVLDVAGLLDRLAARRYVETPRRVPDWWRPYELPPALQQLTPQSGLEVLRLGPGRSDAGRHLLAGRRPPDHRGLRDPGAGVHQRHAARRRALLLRGWPDASPGSGRGGLQAPHRPRHVDIRSAAFIGGDLDWSDGWTTARTCSSACFDGGPGVRPLTGAEEPRAPRQASRSHRCARVQSAEAGGLWCALP